jgi:hypothetical protein
MSASRSVPENAVAFGLDACFIYEVFLWLDLKIQMIITMTWSIQQYQVKNSYPNYLRLAPNLTVKEVLPLMVVIGELG